MSKKPKSGKKRRNSVKNPALNKSYTTRVRQEYLDYDYLEQLNEEELAWLNNFTEQYLNGSFKKDGTDIQPYEKYGKDANDRNNARNRCLYGILKNKDNKFKNKKLHNYDYLVNLEDNPIGFVEGHNPRNIENAYIDFLENKEIQAMLQEYDEAMKNFTEEVSEYPELLQQVIEEQ